MASYKESRNKNLPQCIKEEIQNTSRKKMINKENMGRGFQRKSDRFESNTHGSCTSRPFNQSLFSLSHDGNGASHTPCRTKGDFIDVGSRDELDAKMVRYLNACGVHSMFFTPPIGMRWFVP
jgi:hypothetical protein